MQLIVEESALKVLSIDEFQNSWAFLSVVEKVTLVLQPVTVNIAAILVIIRIGTGRDFIIVNFPFSMEVIHLPLSFVGNFSIGVEKRSESVHFTFQPMTMIFAAINVEECAETISFVVLNLPDVFRSRWVNNTPDFVLVWSRVVVLLFRHVF